MNSTRCVNITVFDDMITGSAKFFTVLLTTYDINVHVIAPNTTTITIEESDCEYHKTTSIWDHFRKKELNTYIIKFPVHE